MVLRQLLKFFHAGRRREEFAAGLDRAIAPLAINDDCGRAGETKFAPWLETDSASPRRRCFHPGSEYLGLQSDLAQTVLKMNRREFKRWLEED